MKTPPYLLTLSHARRRELVKTLNRFAKTGKVPLDTYGICSNLTREMRYTIDGSYIVQILAPGWKHYSGNICYPMPGGEVKFYRTRNLWKGVQGKYRRSLSRYMAKKIEETL